MVAAVEHNQVCCTRCILPVAQDQSGRDRLFVGMARACICILVKPKKFIPDKAGRDVLSVIGAQSDAHVHFLRPTATGRHPCEHGKIAFRSVRLGARLLEDAGCVPAVPRFRAGHCVQHLSVVLERYLPAALCVAFVDMHSYDT